MMTGLMKDTTMISGATFSECKKYRYQLWRDWGNVVGDKGILFIMLNPSIADETINDPTIRRCIGFSKDWGFMKLYVGNIFSFRSTDPKKLKKVDDPVGPDNDYSLRSMAYDSSLIVCAWGNHGMLNGRGDIVRGMLSKAGMPPIYMLRVTKSNQPSHPLYLPGNLKPSEWPLTIS